MTIWADEIVQTLYARLTIRERNGLEFAINQLRETFPAIDIYESILGNGTALSAGRKSISGSKGTPLFVITRPTANRPSCIKIRIDSKQDRKEIEVALGRKWDEINSTKFYLKDIHGSLGQFKVFLSELKSNKVAADIVEKRSNGNGYNPSDYEELKSSLENDMEEIRVNPEIGETDKELLIKARIGQGKFRQSLIELWGGCAVTRYNDSSMLVASHIKPWRSSSNIERLDPYNGFLLLPTIDKAFDTGLITFNLEGVIRISPLLVSPGMLGIHDQMNVHLSLKHYSYIEYHNEYVYRSA